MLGPNVGFTGYISDIFIDLKGEEIPQTEKGGSWKNKRSKVWR